MELGKATDGFVARYINRRLSIRITKAIVKYRLPLTPNQVSVISFLVGVGAAATLALGRPLLAAILVQLSSIIDGVDGELARLLRMSSRLGAFLDAILDRLVDIAIIISLAYYVLHYVPHPSPQLPLIASLLALSGDLMVSYIHARGEASLGLHPSRVGRIPNFSSRDVRLFIIFLGLILGKPLITLLVIAITSYSYVISKFIEVLVSLRGVEREEFRG